MNKEIISASCILLILLLSQLVSLNVCNAESKINTNRKIIIFDPGYGGEDSCITIVSKLNKKNCALKRTSSA